MGEIIINRNKTIGDVVFILEGTDTEFKLFGNLFEKIFSITTIKCRSQKTNLLEYVLPDNRDSVVYLINSKSSSINSVDDTEYISSLFKKINTHFNIDITNSAIYYIWDRDKNSNKEEVVRKILEKYQNSRDNGYEMQGLLLLSYPSIESFIISCFENETPNINIENIKKYLTINKYHYNKIDEKKLINAIKVFIKDYKEILKKDFSVNDIDINMKENNLEIFAYEENYYKNNNYYYYFSCLLISLFDLGIVGIS